jgi:fermentation-respiration switch protein FrsA (DUF1100 family)
MILRSALLLACRRALPWLRLAAVCYLLVLLLLLLLENTLLYPAPKYPTGDWEAASIPHEDVHLASLDGTPLHGWYFDHPQPRAVLLYLHGNGDCVAYLGPYLAALRDKLRLAIFVVDYRGYGRSGGSPFEKGILEDGDAAQRWLAERAGCRMNEVVLMGRSLGGAVAVDLATRNGARGIVLQNTFTSMPDVAAGHYPWAPVRWLMRNRYDSLCKISGYRGPILASHGTADGLVPIEFGRRLFDAAPSERKEFVPIEGGDHNSPEPREYYLALDRWLESLPATSRTE